jgi:hypothetical protein
LVLNRVFVFAAAVVVTMAWNRRATTNVRKKAIEYLDFYLIILAPGVSAFRAPEETHLALICCPELPEPPDCKIVLAFGALDLDGGHGFFLALLLNNHDLVLAADHLAFHLVATLNLTDIPAFPALQLACRRHQHRFAFRTEHRYTMRDNRRLSLVYSQNRSFARKMAPMAK